MGGVRMKRWAWYLLTLLALALAAAAHLGLPWDG